MTEAERIAQELVEEIDGFPQATKLEQEACNMIRSQAAEIDRLHSRCGILKSLRDGQIEHVAAAFQERDKALADIETAKEVGVKQENIIIKQERILKRAAYLLAELSDQSPQLLALRSQIVASIKSSDPKYYGEQT